MNEIDSDRSFIKNEQELCLEQELDLQNCIEEFDRIIYQIPEEFTLNSDFCDGDSNQNLTSEFTYNIEDDGDHGWVGLRPVLSGSSFTWNLTEFLPNLDANFRRRSLCVLCQAMFWIFFSNFNFSRLQNHPPSDQRERDQPHDSAETGELLRRTVARHNNNRGESKVKEFPQLIVLSVTSHEEFVNPFTLSCYHLLMHFHIPHAACVGTQLVYKHLSMHPIAARGRLSLVWQKKKRWMGGRPVISD